MLCFLPVLCIRLKSLRRLQPIQLADDDLDYAVKSDASKEMAGWHVFLFWIPAFCDLIATTLMNIGLIYTPVSIYQMTRVAWISLLIVVGGVGLVGYSGSLVSEIIEAPTFHSMINHLVDGPSNERQLGVVLVGVSLSLFAQVFAAIQFVAEEKIMERYSVTPLVAVGYEGLFGTISIMLCIPILSIPSISKLSPFFDLSRGWHQSVDNSTVLYSGIATAISIAFFNFFGLSVTRHVSATARSLTDTCRTLSIWIISLGLGWEIFLFPASLLQVLGFSLLVYGTFFFNDLVRIPACLSCPVLESSRSITGSSESLLLTSESTSGSSSRCE
ncbi:Transmembrane protein C2orf18 [Termitomyces sp. T112]|nr:Transmembrane protein C2orf18 [Termitomyces sp. T112]